MPAPWEQHTARVSWFPAPPGERTSSGTLPHVGSGQYEDPTTLAVAAQGQYIPEYDAQGEQSGFHFDPSRPSPSIPYRTPVYIDRYYDPESGAYGWTRVESLCGACTIGYPNYKTQGAEMRIDVYGIKRDLGVSDVWMPRR